MGNADKKPLISVIVPVYRVEPYLRACVDSILAQTYTNLEIILVDDGSPDSCGAICDEYAAKDSRVRVIHKENGGLSDARNAGLAVSTGEYLTFVDSDDWLECDAISVLFELLVRSQALISVGGMQRVEDSTDRILATDCSGVETVCTLTKVEAMEDFFRKGCAAWGRLYRKEVFTDIYFPVGEINEDEAIILLLLERCAEVIKTNRIVYNYRFRVASITTTAFSIKNLDWYYHCVANLNWVRSRYPELTKYAIDRLGSCIVFLLHQMAICRYKDRELSSMLLDDLKKGYRDYQEFYLSGKKEKLRMWFLNYFPYSLYCAIISLTGRGSNYYGKM